MSQGLLNNTIPTGAPSLISNEQKIHRTFNFFNFIYHQRIKGFCVPSEPHFDSQSVEFFINQLHLCKQYLEYGVGGITFLAAKLGKDFIAIDSDKYFIKALKSKMQKCNIMHTNSQVFHYADIGLTKQWGQPVFTRLTKLRCYKWERYSSIPVGKINSFLPDLILIDGRFRVACALKVVKYMHNQTNFTMLVDDYICRTHYAEIERFAKLEKLVGRMAVFTQNDKINLLELDNSIASYSLDFR